MSALTPLETLFDTDNGDIVPMPVEIAMLYGKLQFPAHPNGPRIVGNFVETLDGIVSLNIPGHSGGGEISGHNPQDRIVMGILRSMADAVVVGAGTLRAVPHHLWTAEYIFPDLAGAFARFRKLINKAGQPLNVIVTASGDLDTSLPVFQGSVPVLVVTSSKGLQELKKRELPSSVTVDAAPNEGRVSAQTVIECITRVHRCDTILVEGGPQLIGDFFQEELIDELFLTLAPQVAGQDSEHRRPTLVEGKILAPEHPAWGRLISVHRADDHLFLRYGFK